MAQNILNQKSSATHGNPKEYLGQSHVINIHLEKQRLFTTEMKLSTNFGVWLQLVPANQKRTKCYKLAPAHRHAELKT